MKLLSCTALLLCASSSVMASHVVSKCSGIIFKLCPEGYKQEWRGVNPIWYDCYCVRPETATEAALIDKTDKCNQASQKCLVFDNMKSTDDNNSCAQMYDVCELEQLTSVCSTLKDRKTNWQCKEDYANDLGASDEGLDEDYGDDDFYGGEDFDYEDGGDDWDESEDDFGGDDFGDDSGDDFGDDFGDDDFGGDDFGDDYEGGDDFGDDYEGGDDDYEGGDDDYEGGDEDYEDYDYDY